MSDIVKKCSRRNRFGFEYVASAALLLQASTTAWGQTTLPAGGSVASGQVKIGAPVGSTLSVTQGSSRAVVNWDSFSIGSNGTVNFIQPNSSSAILNRVTGSAQSTIAGTIKGNGEVLLVNPNGIAITSSGTVQVGGGFVASTLGISDTDFYSGKLNFLGAGNPAAVSNAGTISGGAGAFVGLIGGSVANSGTITVPLGKVGLGAAQQATIDPTGDGFLQVAVPAGSTAADGRAIIDVAGRIKANGGSVEIKAATVAAAIRNAVNVSGTISAASVSGRNGNIVLDGGAGGVTTVSGKLLATGNKKAKGGAITVTGETVELRGALIDASGGTGGGSILIGTDAAGLQRAVTTTVDQSSVIKADAKDNGNGGNIKVWSDDATDFGGRIFARGGPEGGNGGTAEVSGQLRLTLTNDYSKTALADLSAPKGKTGTLLFDPGTVNIVDQASVGGVALNGPDTFTAQFISTQLGSANVTIDTNNATGANGTAGDINLLSSAQIAWSTGNRLTFNAAHDINFATGASITGTGAGAGLTLRADSGGTGSGTINFVGGTQVSLPLGGVDIYYNPASNRTPGNGGNNPAAGTVNSSSYATSTAAENWSGFVSAGTLTPRMLVNSVYDLQNINNNLNGNYALGTSIDASATSGWNLGAGFLPLGTNTSGAVVGAGFSGNFDGGGHLISNLSINRTLSSDVGLFGYLSGSVSNVGLVGASINGAGNVGGLAGVNAGAINGTFAGGSVSALLTSAGGLVGWNKSTGTINNSYATDAVSAVVSTAGGLVGLNDGNIVSSYASGSTFSVLFSGGLVGSNTGSITQSYFDNMTTGLLAGVGLGNSSGVLGLATSVLQNGSLQPGFNSSIWTAGVGVYPLLNWQIPVTLPPPGSTIVITATDSSGGHPVYGAPPAFGFTVTDTFGNVLCTILCSSYFTGAPLIASSLTSNSGAGTSATAYVGLGTLVANTGFAFKFVNETLSVVPRSLTVTADGQSKTYGSTASLGSTAFTASGLVNGDFISGVTLSSSGSSATATVTGGPYGIAISGAVGSGLLNYVISYVGGLLSVLPAPVVVTARGGVSAVGSSPVNPGLAAVGLKNGDTVSSLTGLSNSFGISASTQPGAYTLGVAGTLGNPNYTLAGTVPGLWTVTPLRGSMTDGPGSNPPAAGSNPPPAGSSPSTAGMSGNTPPANGGGATGALGNLSGAVNTKQITAAGGGGSSQSSASGSGSATNGAGAGGSGSGTNSAGAGGGAAAPGQTPPASVPGRMAEPVGDPNQTKEADCTGEICGQDASKPSRGLVDFALSRLNRKALFDAFDRGSKEIENSRPITSAAAIKVATGLSLVVAAGFVSWILRGGLLAGVLVSSMPLLRGFDPLVVVLNRRRYDRANPSHATAERIFDRVGNVSSLRASQP